MIHFLDKEDRTLCGGVHKDDIPNPYIKSGQDPAAAIRNGIACQDCIAILETTQAKHELQPVQT